MTKPFPKWIRRSWGAGPQFEATKDLLEEHGMHTVCQSARCPNQGECWQDGTATLLILGKVCTRNCGFCSVQGGQPALADPSEPARVAKAVQSLKLRHAVITSVTRDDLDDGGAAHFAETVRAIRSLNANTTVEVLVPDLLGRRENIQTVLEAAPEVFGHNVETVRRLYPELRGEAHAYDGALAVLRHASELTHKTVIKSGLMVGHGETVEEVEETLRDLRGAGCEVVTIGQYLRPSKEQREVREFIRPEQFVVYEDRARALGFNFVWAGPFVRSSYRAGMLFENKTKKVSAS